MLLGWLTRRAPPSPRAASRPPPRTRRGAPKRRTSASPEKRPTSIATENAANPSAATPLLASSTSRRYRPLQSAIAPSPIDAHRARAPRSQRERGGNAKAAAASLFRESLASGISQRRIHHM